VADPFAADGSRAYRSGDRARWRAHGQLEFAGRVDDQVKVRGFRVELGEVEAVLAAHPGVAAAAVAADGRGAERRLVAYLVPAHLEAGMPATDELRRSLRRRLPGFMVPAVFTELASLPLTPAGKLDRAALPSPPAARPELARAYVAPSTPTQELLAGIWAQVLGVDRVGIHDSFFELGGHSFRAVEVVSGIRSEFEIEFSIADFFDHPTIAEIAAAISRSTVGIDSDSEEYDEFEF
jgi:acyl carrier protein